MTRQISLSILSVLFVSQFIRAQLPVKNVFLTKEAFETYIAKHVQPNELGGRKLLAEKEANENISDSFRPTFDDFGTFESIELWQSNGRQYFIQRLSEQTYVVQKGRKKLRKRRYNISLEPEATNTRKSRRLWNHTWNYIEQLIPE
jgi:hypothetical protein